MITLGSGNTLYKRCYKNTPDDCAKLVELTGKYRVQQPVTQSGLVELEIAYKNIRMPVFMGDHRDGLHLINLYGNAPNILIFIRYNIFFIITIL